MVGPNDMPPAPTIVIFGPSCLSEEIAESLTRGRLITPEQGWALHEKVGGAGSTRSNSDAVGAGHHVDERLNFCNHRTILFK